MSAEAMKPNPPSTEGEKYRQIERENKQLANAFTSRLNDLHQIQKSGSIDPHMGDEDEQGLRIITISGTNTGATMKGDLLDRHQKQRDNQEELPGEDDQQPEGLDSLVNSNFQAVNNSIMFGSSYTSNDPGVHMEIADVVDSNGGKVEKQGRRGLRKGKEPAQGVSA